MKEYIIEKYVISANGELFELIKTNHNVVLFRVVGDSKLEFELNKVEDNSLQDFLRSLYNKISVAKIGYAAKYLFGHIKDPSCINFEEYADVDVKSINGFILKRYYYNPKGKLFEKLFDRKWQEG